MAATAKPEQIDRFRIRRGDTLITKDSETADDIGIPAFVEYEADDLVCGYHLAIVRPVPELVDPRFLFWVLSSQFVLEQWAVKAAGVTRVGIRSSDLNRVDIPIPPLAEQRAIADYLDRETAQIDDLVTKNRNLTETIIGRMKAETRNLLAGIDLPGVVVDSGLWFPYLPTGWRSVPIRHLGKTGSGSGFPVELQGVSGQEFEFFKVKHLASIDPNGYLQHSEDTISDETRQLLRATSFPVNSIVYAKVGAALMLGRFGLLPRAGCIDNNMSALVVDEELFDPTFIRLQLEQIDMAYLVNPGAIPSMSDKNFSAMKLPIPNRAMQASIVAEVDGKLEKYRRLLEETNKTIELMLERRAALITAAVTGQIDVSQGRAA